MRWAERLPKAELHVHLEGAIPDAALWQLIAQVDGPEAMSLEELRARLVYRDFPHFIETWVWKNRYLRSYDDFTLIAEAVARSWQAQNIRYVEAFCSPADFFRHGLKAPELLAAIRAGLDRVPEVEVALVVDLIRDFGPEQGARVLEEVAEARALGVIGIGIGGSEQRYPPEPWAPVYARARALGLRTSAHAGEAAGAGSVRGALDSLQVDRVGHATRATEDPALVEELIRRRVPLEMCPLSNVRTGVVARLEEHPIADFLRRGAFVTVNTDDPAMFGNRLAEEYEGLVRCFELTPAEVRQLSLNAVDASWLPEARKAALRASFEAELAELLPDDAW